MTREEAKAIIRKEYLCVDRDCDIEKNCGRCDLMMPSKEPILEAYKMAIQALEQEPSVSENPNNCEMRDATLEERESIDKYIKSISKPTGVKFGALEQEPCEDCRNCKKWDDCECGRKGHINGTSSGYSIGECKDYEPCEDAVSRQAVLGTIARVGLLKNETKEVKAISECLREVEKLQPVKPQEPKTVLYSGDGYADGYMVYDMAECPNCGYEYEDGDKDWGLSFCPNCGQKLNWESEVEE